MYEDIPTYDDIEYEYEDFYEDDNLYWEGDREESYSTLSQSITFSQLTTACIIPTLTDSLFPISKLIICIVILRIITSLVTLKPFMIHTLSVMVGLVALQIFAQYKMIYVIILCCLSYLALFTVQKTINKKYGPVGATAAVLFLVICEVFVVESKEWHIIRGIQMIITMKVISLSFDLDNGVTSRLPKPIEFFGYCLCPGSVIFGPWHSYQQYLNLFSKLQLSGIGALFLRILISGFVGIFFLLLSACFTQWITLDDENKWFVAYRDALSFRSSHYFISFISEFTLLIAGVESFQMNVWKCFVSQPHKIEFPRSLTEVVIAWNIPMHYWLKTYVFKVVKPLNTFAGIFSTYAASSLLHGLNFQLAAVLFSLGFYTYVEFIFRQKLASVFNACILARRCRSDCSHHYKEYHLLVFLTNLGFLILTVFHLAYLGVMFGDNSSLQDEGYNMNHTLTKWSHLNYASHWIVLGMYTIFFLV